MTFCWHIHPLCHFICPDILAVEFIGTHTMTFCSLTYSACLPLHLSWPLSIRVHIIKNNHPTVKKELYRCSDRSFGPLTFFQTLSVWTPTLFQTHKYPNVVPEHFRIYYCSRHIRKIVPHSRQWPWISSRMTKNILLFIFSTTKS